MVLNEVDVVMPNIIDLNQSRPPLSKKANLQVAHAPR